MNPILRIIPAAIALAVAGTPAYAQTSDAERIKQLERKLERSLELIEQLSAKINRIEQANAGARPAPDPSPQQAAKITALEKQVSELGGALARQAHDDGLPIHGFADAGLVKSNESNPTATGRKGAFLGGMDLYLTPRFGDRVKTLIEILFEAESNGETAADLERLQVGYVFSDAATVWAGRFHTPYGYWNTAFHHGAQIQTSVQRPRFLDFEHDGGVMPAHTTGLWLNGSTRNAGGRFGYDLYTGNAPQITGVASGAALPTALATANPAGFSPAVIAGTYAGSGSLNPRHGGSSTHRTSSGFNAWFEPDAVHGLRVGLHGLRADVVDDAAAANRTLVKMTGGHVTYTTEPWEAMGEYYRFRNEDRSGATGTHGSWAGYAQVGYNLGRWTPYGRAERSKLDQTDNYFGVQANGRSYRRTAFGLRFDVDPKAALKVELNSTRKEDLGTGGPDSYPELHMQYAIRF